MRGERFELLVYVSLSAFHSNLPSLSVERNRAHGLTVLIHLLYQSSPNRHSPNPLDQTQTSINLPSLVPTQPLRLPRTTTPQPTNEANLTKLAVSYAGGTVRAGRSALE